MIFTTHFEYETAQNSLDEFRTDDNGKIYKNCLVAFIHAEENDQNDAKGVEDKLLKNVKWAAKKNETNIILLHSFAHLSETKADAGFTKKLFDAVENRLKNADYQAFQTPFGYFLNLKVEAPGNPLSRLFKSF